VKLDNIGAVIAGVALADVLARSSTTPISSDRSWLRQPPKPSLLYLTLPMSSVINSFPCVLIGQNRESPKEDPRVFQNAATCPSSKLSWSLDIPSVSAIRPKHGWSSGVRPTSTAWLYWCRLKMNEFARESPVPWNVKDDCHLSTKLQTEHLSPLQI